MEQLHNGFTLELCPGAFPLSTDSMILADFVRLGAHAQVLDLGSGCGTLGLLLCAKDNWCKVTGIELTEEAHLCALENARRNGIGDRLFSICAPLQAISRHFPPGAFSCCVSNPPYFPVGSHAAAPSRREDRCTLPQLFQSAAWALRYGGDFFLVHRPERLAEVIRCASAAGLEPKRLRLVHHRPQSAISLILLQCRKGGKPGLLWEELTLFHPDGTPTDAYRRIYHI